MTNKQTILYEGPCAYVVLEGGCHKVMIYSTNSIQHIEARNFGDDGARAEQVARRLNAYPHNTRKSYGLL